MRLWVKIKPVKRLLSLLVSLILLSSVAAAAQQASLAGNVIHLPVLTFVDQVFQIELSIVEATDPVEVLLTHASELTNANTDDAASFDGVMLSIPSIDVDGTIYWANFRLLSAEPPTFVLGAAGTVASNPPLQSCTRPEPDSSHGPDETTLISGFLVPPSEIFDGGPGPDGIPAIQSPLFSNDFALTDIQPDHLVIGVKINVGDSSKVYPISRFAAGVSVVNDRVGDMDVVATGSASQNFAVVYNRQLEDCTTLNFNPVENQLPVVMIDDEGNRWDIFGTALSGPRVGTRLQKTNSYIAYWLA
tara:strand:- start:288 stop:1196 length:909 start_codon:yes stop_codon:yes gene_type:complete